jgi:Rrf2 family protein
MRISSKGEYGLRALFDLAQRYGEGPIQSHEIHIRQGIDENYLNQILILLRRAGLIESIRGPQGGHLLARSPAQINLLDAIIALEGPLLPFYSGRDALTPVDPIDREIVREIWLGTRAAIESYLSGVTLDDMLQRKRRHTGEMMYYI